MVAGSDGQSAGSWLDQLEMAQRRVVAAATLLGGDQPPSVDLAPAARAIERAVASIFDAFDHRAPGLAAVQRAIDELRAAYQLMSTETTVPAVRAAAEGLGHAASHLTAAQQTLQSLPLDPTRSADRELRASGDLPLLHDIERPSLTLAVKVCEPAAPPPERPEPLPRPTTFEELHASVTELERRNQERGRAREAKATQAELEAARKAAAEDDVAAPPPGFDVDVRPALDELGFIHARTRDHFEEVAMLGLQRSPMFGDPWRTSLILEQRMLRAIDAIASMGPSALRHVEPLVFDSPAKDPTRVFGITMVLGCIRGRDALAAAERVFLDFEKIEPECAAALADALKLIPHDQLVVALHSLLRDPDPRHRAIGIEVLAHRGMASEEQLLSAASDTAIVAAKALPQLALVAPGRCGAAIDQALGDPEVERASVWLAMALAGHRATRVTLSEALQLGAATEPALRDQAAVLLALCGDQNDGALLREQAQRAPSPGIVEALGWVGDPASFAALLHLLEHEDEALTTAAGSALDRITGAALREQVELDAEEIFVIVPPDPDVGEKQPPKLVHAVSDPRDLPPEPAKETIERPSTDPAQWSAWIAEHGQAMKAGTRHRRGRRYSPAVTLDELDSQLCSVVERRALVWELVIRTGGYVRLDPHDFVRVQEAALTEWAPLARRSVTSGSWDRPGRR